MSSLKKEMEFVKGKRYPGYGWINDYGEFEFTPEQTGSRAGQTSIVKAGDDYTVSKTKNYVLVHLRLKRPFKPTEGVFNLMRRVDEIIKVFKEYEF